MSKAKDRKLGMHRDITRRDLMHGIGAAAFSTMLPGCVGATSQASRQFSSPASYPPALDGLRGNHLGSFEVAHKLAREGQRDWGDVTDVDGADYDLVVVGAGISGLAAAHFYRQQHPHARILILDNHDDFGGHAKRNEFDFGDKTVIGYGGSQTLEEPSGYPEIVKRLLLDLGVDVEKFYGAYDEKFFQRHGLRGTVFFDEENWGANRLVDHDLGSLRYTLPLAGPSNSVEEAVAAMPMSPAARAEMRRLLTSKRPAFPGMSRGDRAELLESISYRDYLSDYLKITEPEVFAALQPLTTDLGGGIEAVPAMSSIAYIGLPGADAAGFPIDEGGEPYIHHFPDGNASIARLMVRELIPDVADGSTMEDVLTAKFDYSKLDTAGSAARLRLNSTVVDVRHVGKPNSSQHVDVRYIRHGRHEKIRARQCVLACNNAIIPAMCPDMPEAQKRGLSGGMKVPILYTNVALNNWHAWKNLGVGAISAPNGYHVNAMLDFPVDLGNYQFSNGPDEPIVAHMERFFHRPNVGLSKRQQAPLGRIELLSTSFETIERNVRQQLALMLGEGGFDPAKDIAAITVNRWAHGYATRDWLEDDYFDNSADIRYPHVAGRQPFGRIVIANSDAGALATVDSAVIQAHRAISELS